MIVTVEPAAALVTVTEVCGALALAKTTPECDEVQVWKRPLEGGLTRRSAMMAMGPLPAPAPSKSPVTPCEDEPAKVVLSAKVEGVPVARVAVVLDTVPKQLVRSTW